MLSAFKGWMFILSCTLCRFVGAALKGISFPGRLLVLLLWEFPSLADSWCCSYGYFLPWQTLGAALKGISFPGRLLGLLLWVFPSLADSRISNYMYMVVLFWVFGMVEIVLSSSDHWYYIHGSRMYITHI